MISLISNGGTVVKVNKETEEVMVQKNGDWVVSNCKIEAIQSWQSGWNPESPSLKSLVG